MEFPSTSLKSVAYSTSLKKELAVCLTTLGQNHAEKHCRKQGCVILAAL